MDKYKKIEEEREESKGVHSVEINQPTWQTDICACWIAS